jgi:hypothetical protein
MIDLDDVRLYLPKYLSPDTEHKLLEDLNDFPNNIDSRMYGFTGKQADIIYQGDGIRDLLVVNLPSPDIRSLPSMVFSNTCDVDPANARKFFANVLYSPIISMVKYASLMVRRDVFSESSVEQHLAEIRAQRVVQVFYLPSGHNLREESLVLFDHIVHCDNRAIKRDDLENTRLFSLSQYGLYLFLYKISVFITRLHENVDRSYSRVS